MTMEAERIDQPTKDPVSNVLKWVLLVVAVVSFAILGLTTKLMAGAPVHPLNAVSRSSTCRDRRASCRARRDERQAGC
jgi:hypothetical protein